MMKYLVLLFLAALLMGATTTRLKTFQDGEVLTAADLNAEFNNLISNINSLDETNLSPATIIPPLLIEGNIAGDGLVRDAGDGVLSVNVDGTTVQIIGNVLTSIGSAPPVSSVTSAMILDLTIQGVDIAPNAITTDKLAPGAGGGAKAPTSESGFDIANSGPEIAFLGACATGTVCVMRKSAAIHRFDINLSTTGLSTNKKYTIDYTMSRDPGVLNITCQDDVGCVGDTCERKYYLSSGTMLTDKVKKLPRYVSSGALTSALRPEFSDTMNMYIQTTAALSVVSVVVEYVVSNSIAGPLQMLGSARCEIREE